MSALPLIGVTACTRQLGLHPFHIAGDKYLRAVVEGAEGMPLVIPALADLIATDALLERLDGLLFTGSPSNVEPHHYQGPASLAGTHHDAARDAYTLPLLRLAIDRGIPVFCICRGFQELNVALGGSLHQRVQELPGHADHREPQSELLAEQYAPTHPVTVPPGGVFERLGLPASFQVNSLHSQGIARLAPGLRIEAQAPDGLVEGVSLANAPGFVVGVQWHPEWNFRDNPESLALLDAFRYACQRHAAAR